MSLHSCLALTGNNELGPYPELEYTSSCRSLDISVHSINCAYVIATFIEQEVTEDLYHHSGREIGL